MLLNGKYSPIESKILSILKNGKEATISQITDRVYKNREAPANDRESVRGIITRLQKKLRANREKTKICRTKRNGPHEIQYWLE